MNKIGLIVLLIIFCLSPFASATLVDNGDGTITQIRSDGSKLMWLQDASYAKTSGYDSDGLMLWSDAYTWASNIVYAGYDDWRLPMTDPINGTSWNVELRYDGTTDNGYNITSLNSEMAYMFYVELGNQGQRGLDGTLLCDPCTTNSGLFTNLQAGADYDRHIYSYWANNGYVEGMSYIYFNFYVGD